MEEYKDDMDVLATAHRDMRGNAGEIAVICSVFACMPSEARC
jgi:hypothetical protein